MYSLEKMSSICEDRSRKLLAKVTQHLRLQWLTKHPRFQQFAQCINSLKSILIVYTGAAIVVFVVNICWLVWAKFKYGIYHEKNSGMLGFGLIFKGNCNQATRIDTYLHLLINFLSTMLLSGTNSVLAAYSSPTRAEIDRAHRASKQLNVGVHRPRNFLYISKLRTGLCLLLIATSLPFSLVFNSLVFSSISANEYRWAVVSRGFLQNEPLALHPFHQRHYKISGARHDYEEYKAIQRNWPTYEYLDAQMCVDTYFGQLQSSRRNLLLIALNESRPFRGGSLLSFGYSRLSRQTFQSNIVCGTQSTPGAICPPPPVQKGNYFNIHGFNVTHCLSERVTAKCSVQFNGDIMVVALICNLVKICIFIFVLVRLNLGKLLVTMGDAVASFLTIEDQSTSGMCLMTSTFKSSWTPLDSPKEYNRRWCSRKYSHAHTRSTWAWVASLAIVSTVSLALGTISFSVLDRSHTFGKLNLRALAFSTNQISNISLATIVANSPQLALSAFYLAYQNLLTAMFLVRDWSDFGLASKGLMVSKPSGAQRNAWFFGMPLLPGVFVQATAVVFHWVISQAIFPVRIELFDANSHPLSRLPVIHNCGYSVPPMATGVCLGALLVGIVWCLARGKFEADGRPPIVGTSSAAISASCHYQPTKEEDAANVPYQRLRWGAIGEPVDGVGHCTLAPASEWEAGRMYTPIEGEKYA